jgi:5-bromo-4-chloroindolyl phosphate hydrolysis protein
MEPEEEAQRITKIPKKLYASARESPTRLEKVGKLFYIKKIDNCVTKFSFATKTGINPSNAGKVNQDAYICVPHFCNLKYSHFFSVCDGHG